MCAKPLGKVIARKYPCRRATKQTLVSM